MAVALKPKQVAPTLNNTLTSGITLASGVQDIVAYAQLYTYDNIRYKYVLRTNALTKATTNASLGFGEHLFTFPTGVIRPIGGTLKVASVTATAAGTAGEWGAGTTIASGAIATLGAGSAAMENLLEGTTISNHVAGTTLTMKNASQPVAYGDHGAGSISSGVNVGAGGVFDNTAGTKKFYLNGASAFDAVGTITFTAYVAFMFDFLGTDFGIE